MRVTASFSELGLSFWMASNSAQSPPKMSWHALRYLSRVTSGSARGDTRPAPLRVARTFFITCPETLPFLRPPRAPYNSGVYWLMSRFSASSRAGLSGKLVAPATRAGVA